MNKLFILLIILILLILFLYYNKTQVTEYFYTSNRYGKIYWEHLILDHNFTISDNNSAIFSSTRAQLNRNSVLSQESPKTE